MLQQALEIIASYAWSERTISVAVCRLAVIHPVAERLSAIELACRERLHGIATRKQPALRLHHLFEVNWSGSDVRL